jgi:hypothetical protein
MAVDSIEPIKVGFLPQEQAKAAGLPSEIRA